MDKYIYDESNGLWYELQGDYYIPCLILPTEKEHKPIGLWGQRHKRYLQEHKRAVYITLLTSGKLNCYLSFRDGQGVPHRLELDVKLYAVFDRFELDDLSFLNEQERHLDWTELNEELLSRRSAQEPAPVEDAVYESMQTQALREGVNQLPEVQKRRLQMYFFDGLTYEEIAVREGCSYQAVQKSIAAALKKIRKFLK